MIEFSVIVVTAAGEGTFVVLADNAREAREQAAWIMSQEPPEGRWHISSVVPV